MICHYIAPFSTQWCTCNWNLGACDWDKGPKTVILLFLSFKLGIGKTYAPLRSNRFLRH